ncbi:MAG: SpoIIIAH-like family protein [Oscillospiraceae bacterium]|jgi:stage III sporulation protein AH|nr:SpoIIIAH-like family protein [Oscillospiraceae bacterium]
MRTFKRNAVIVTVTLFVCVAAYLNWSYGKQTEGEPAEGLAEDVSLSEPGQEGLPPDTEADAPGDGDVDEAGLFYGGIGKSAESFFAEARINRSRARDAAVETLTSVNAADGASKETLDAALSKITEIADYSRLEAEIEALIMARGFSDCVAFISDSGVKITVPAPQAGLSTVDVAKITDVVTEETEFSAARLKIIEVR